MAAFSEPLNESIDLAEAHGALSHLEPDSTAIVVEDASSHASGSEVIHDASHSILHQKLAKDVPHIDRLAGLHAGIEAIEEAERLELVCVVKLRFNASALAHLVLPVPQLLQNYILIPHNSVLQIAEIEILHYARNINAEFNEVA